MKKYNYLIIGGGIIGLTVARELKERFHDKAIAIIEKEPKIACHASGRNSGVLHAGFYYTKDSLKAKFTRDGNRALRDFCKKHGLKINECGKLVVAKNEYELSGLEELKRRAELNGVVLDWVNEKEMHDIDPNARTFKKALFSPNTATVDPLEVCNALMNENIRNGVEIHFNTKFIQYEGKKILTSNGIYEADHIINCAGLFADKIAHQYGFGLDYTIIPFKGLYLKYKKNKEDIKTNIYPVPNLKNPFLGVHFTKTFNGDIKIGPTAIPAFWREHYNGFQNFKLNEFLQIFLKESELFLRNSFHFRSLAFEEIKKYRKTSFIKLALQLVKKMDVEGFGDFLKPGIRAQLLNKRSNELVQDFVIEGDQHSTHILNAVSPAFTCSIPFAKYVVDLILKKCSIGVI